MPSASSAASASAFSSVAAPAYIAEVSPPRFRGRLGSLQQLAIVCGIFLSLALTGCRSDLAGGASKPLWLGLAAWRWTFLSELILALLYFALLRSPFPSRRAISLPAQIPEARRVLAMLLGEKNLEITIDRITETLEREDKPVVARSAEADGAGSTASSGSASGCRSSSSSSAST